MDYNILGKTGMNISRLGIGLAEIGIEGTTQKNVTELLNTAIDLGINFFDTAACYNNSEDLVGNAINSRRDEFFLATKCGHPTNRINGTEWTKDIISKTIDDSLKRLKTDYLDLIQLHSCEKEILEKLNDPSNQEQFTNELKIPNHLIFESGEFKHQGDAE